MSFLDPRPYLKNLWNRVMGYDPDPYPREHKEAFEAIRSACRQPNPEKFKDILPEDIGVEKVARGGYGEIFKVFSENQGVCIYKVLKLFYYHFEYQEDAHILAGCIDIPDALVELQANIRMRDLREGTVDSCETFIFIEDMYLIYDGYPAKFVRAQKVYVEKDKEIRPIINRRKYYMLVYKMEYRGIQLFDFPDNKRIHPYQARAIMQQLMLALRIAERRMEFEHRDLYPKNILIDLDRPQSTVSCYLNNQDFSAEYDVFVTIIDFGLSRFIDSDGNVIFINLSELTGNSILTPHILEWSEFHLESNAFFAAYYPETLQKFHDIDNNSVCLKQPFYRYIYDFELECRCKHCVTKNPKGGYVLGRRNDIFLTKIEHDFIVEMSIAHPEIPAPGICRRLGALDAEI